MRLSVIPYGADEDGKTWEGAGMENHHDRGDVGFVLIHGSELGAWLWDRVVPLLRRPALAVDLPGRRSRPADRRSLSLDDAVGSVVKDVEAWGVDRVILVAHSFSGILLPTLARKLGDRVAAVVLVGADVPEEGRGWVDLRPPAQRIFLRLLYRLRPGGALSPRGSNRKTLATTWTSRPPRCSWTGGSPRPRGSCWIRCRRPRSRQPSPATTSGCSRIAASQRLPGSA